MKKFFQYAFAAVIAVGAFTSCSDDDDPVVPGANIENKSYTATDGLKLVVNGEPLVGKTITFTKGADDNATIKLAGEGFDLSSIMGQIGTKAEIQQPGLMVPTCGVIPGSPEYEFQVKLIGTGDECVFEGGEETEYCTFKYSGKVTKDALDFNITDLKLKNTSLAGTSWSPYSYEAEDWYGEMQTNYQDIYVGWDSEKNIEVFPGWSLQPGTVVAMALAMTPVVVNESTMTIHQALGTALQEVSFTEDGNIRAKYIDFANGETTPKDSPLNVCQYVITDNGKLLLYLNPATIIASIAQNAAKSRAVDYTTAISQALEVLLPYLRNGFPMVYGEYTGESYDFPDEGATPIYFALPTEVMVPILKILSPILADPDVQAQLVEMASKDPNMGSLAGMLPGILSALPDVVAKTSKCEVGLFMMQN